MRYEQLTDLLERHKGKWRRKERHDTTKRTLNTMKARNNSQNNCSQCRRVCRNVLMLTGRLNRT